MLHIWGCESSRRQLHKDLYELKLCSILQSVTLMSQQCMYRSEETSVWFGFFHLTCKKENRYTEVRTVYKNKVKYNWNQRQQQQQQHGKIISQNAYKNRNVWKIVLPKRINASLKWIFQEREIYKYINHTLI